MTKLTVFAQARELSWVSAVAFCATMLERQIANFELFCEITETDDDEQMRKALDQLWLGYEASVAGKRFSTNLALLRDKVEAVSPDAAEHDHFGVIPAIDFSMALVAAISHLAKEEETGAVIVSKLSQGSVESVILATEGELESPAIKTHELMQREITFQQQLLQQLNVPKAKLPKSGELKAFAQADGASNIGIEFS